MKKLAIVLFTIAAMAAFGIMGCSSQGDQEQAVGSGDAGAAAATYASLEDFEAAHATAAEGNAAYAKMAGFDCTVCHGMDSAALFEAYQADPESISVSRDTCTTCHSEAKWPEELEATYENIKDWNTYVGVGTEEHQAWVDCALQYTTGRPPMGDYEQECALCHTMHEPTQTMYCTQCHNPDQGTGDCMTCHERILGEGMEFEGQTAEEATAVLMQRLEENGGHIDSVMHAPDGWAELDSIAG